MFACEFLSEMFDCEFLSEMFDWDFLSEMFDCQFLSEMFAWELFSKMFDSETQKHLIWKVSQENSHEKCLVNGTLSEMIKIEVPLQQINLSEVKKHDWNVYRKDIYFKWCHALSFEIAQLPYGFNIFLTSDSCIHLYVINMLS